LSGKPRLEAIHPVRCQVVVVPHHVPAVKLRWQAQEEYRWLLVQCRRFSPSRIEHIHVRDGMLDGAGWEAR
jgi:hypothetical protein